MSQVNPRAELACSAIRSRSSFSRALSSARLRRDVGAGPEQPDRPAGRVVGGPAPVRHPSDLAVVADDPVLAFVEPAALDGGPQRRHHPVSVIGVDHAEEAVPGALVLADGDAADAAAILRPHHHVGAEVPRPHPGVGGLHGQSQPLVALAEPRLPIAQLPRHRPSLDRVLDRPVHGLGGQPGLADIVLGPGPEDGAADLRADLAGEDHHRADHQSVRAHQALEDLGRVHVGQIIIDHQAVGWALAFPEHGLDRGRAQLGLDEPITPLGAREEHPADLGPIVRAVVDHHDAPGPPGRRDQGLRRHGSGLSSSGSTTRVSQ